MRRWRAPCHKLCRVFSSLPRLVCNDICPVRRKKLATKKTSGAPSVRGNRCFFAYFSPHFTRILLSRNLINYGFEAKAITLNKIILIDTCFGHIAAPMSQVRVGSSAVLRSFSEVQKFKPSLLFSLSTRRANPLASSCNL